MNLNIERPIDVVRTWLSSDAVIPPNIYRAVLLLVEFAEAQERASDLMEELT